MAELPSIPIEKAKDYILSGRAVVIFVNTETGENYKYKIKQFKEREDMWWVNTLLNNPDTGRPYLLGTIKFTDFRVTGYLDRPNFKWEFTPNRDYISEVVQQYKDTFKAMWQRIARGYWKKNSNEAEIYKIMHDGTCGRCGRQLTTVESIRLGIGPECLKYIQNANS